MFAIVDGDRTRLAQRRHRRARQIQRRDGKYRGVESAVRIVRARCVEQRVTIPIARDVSPRSGTAGQRKPRVGKEIGQLFVGRH